MIKLATISKLEDAYLEYEKVKAQLCGIEFTKKQLERKLNKLHKIISELDDEINSFED